MSSTGGDTSRSMDHSRQSEQSLPAAPSEESKMVDDVREEDMENEPSFEHSELETEPRARRGRGWSFSSSSSKYVLYLYFIYIFIFPVQFLFLFFHFFCFIFCLGLCFSHID